MVATTVERYRSAGDAAAVVDLDALTDGELDDELVGLLRERHRLDAEIARRSARWDARVVWITDGSRSAAARLGRDGHLAPPSSAGLIRRARASRSMPATCAAWSRGDVGGDAVDVLARAAGAGRDELFARDERMLVGFFDELSHVQASKAVRYWCQRADAELQRDGAPPPPPVSLHVSTTFDGAVSGDFVLDPVGGAAVIEGLRRIERELYQQDQRDGVVRSKAERMGAALVEMAVRAHSVPSDARRPEPLVTILAGESSIEHLLELASGVVLDAHTVIPHLCRATVQTFIFDGADRVVAASKQRTFRGTLRRAIQVRDRHCQHPSGCDASIVECDVNHIRAWIEGGVTDELGGDLECHPHNRKSDLHGRAPAADIAEARWRREAETVIRQRLEALMTEQANRPPPAVA